MVGTAKPLLLILIGCFYLGVEDSVCQCLFYCWISMFILEYVLSAVLYKKQNQGQGLQVSHGYKFSIHCIVSFISISVRDNYYDHYFSDHFYLTFIK